MAEGEARDDRNGAGDRGGVGMTNLDQGDRRGSNAGWCGAWGALAAWRPHRPPACPLAGAQESAPTGLPWLQGNRLMLRPPTMQVQRMPNPHSALSGGRLCVRPPGMI